MTKQQAKRRIANDIYLQQRIENHSRTLGEQVNKRILMSIAYESEMIELIASHEKLSNAQLNRHIELLHQILGLYDLPDFDSFVLWHKELVNNATHNGIQYGGKIRTFPAGRVLKDGSYRAYPTYSEHTLYRKFDVFNSLNNHSLLGIADFHCQITEAHPFLDCNGRVCRLLLNAHLHILGFGMVLISRNIKNDYLDCLENRDVFALAQLIENNLVM